MGYSLTFQTSSLKYFKCLLQSAFFLQNQYRYFISFLCMYFNILQTKNFFFFFLRIIYLTRKLCNLLASYDLHHTYSKKDVCVYLLGELKFICISAFHDTPRISKAAELLSRIPNQIKPNPIFVLPHLQILRNVTMLCHVLKG